MSKYITNYVDKYGNMGYGRVVILGEEENGHIKIISPIDFKNRWSSICISSVTKIPSSMNLEIGFYSKNTHYEIMNVLGKTNYLCSSTKKYLNELKNDSDSKIYTWYSDGYNIKEDISYQQERLF